ncbi:zinc-binding dehydrogenase, partial [Streptomyces sp. NRRL B-24572]|uniref:zinc-binding dehydrogenase n=1 Tax=Streptomyces sp. NRRL B-24572 TaxID=1962156 RepID=UPI00117BEF32
HEERAADEIDHSVHRPGDLLRRSDHLVCPEAAQEFAVGGPLLVDAYDTLGEGGTLVALGHSAGTGEDFPFGALFGDQGRHDRSVVTFFLLNCAGLDRDLSWLAHRVADGTLDPGITWRGGWDDAADAVAALRAGGLHGKAVLTFDGLG